MIRFIGKIFSKMVRFFKYNLFRYKDYGCDISEVFDEVEIESVKNLKENNVRLDDFFTYEEKMKKSSAFYREKGSKNIFIKVVYQRFKRRSEGKGYKPGYEPPVSKMWFGLTLRGLYNAWPEGISPVCSRCGEKFDFPATMGGNSRFGGNSDVFSGDRIDSSRGYEDNNITIICKGCNEFKWEKPPNTIITKEQFKSEKEMRRSRTVLKVKHKEDSDESVFCEGCKKLKSRSEFKNKRNRKDNVGKLCYNCRESFRRGDHIIFSDKMELDIDGISQVS